MWLQLSKRLGINDYIMIICYRLINDNNNYEFTIAEEYELNSYELLSTYSVTMNALINSCEACCYYYIAIFFIPQINL